MKYRLVVKEEALADIAEAMKWYQPKSVSLDDRFLAIVERTFQKITANPFAFKKVYRNFRQTSLRPFPYVILYMPEKNTVVVYAVFNTWQHPKKKLSRLKK